MFFSGRRLHVVSVFSAELGFDSGYMDSVMPMKGKYTFNCLQFHGVRCVAMSCGGGFTPDGAYGSVWDSVKPMTGNFFFYYFQYQEDVDCVCVLNGWLSSNDDICPDNYNYSRFTLKDKCRSEKWEVYLYGDMTIKVMGSRRAENCGVSLQLQFMA